MTAGRYSLASAEETGSHREAEADPTAKKGVRRMRPLTIAIIYVLCLLAVQLLFVVLRYNLHGVDYYRVVRAHSLVTIEFAMFIGSFFLWRRLCSASAAVCFPKCVNENGSHALIPFGHRWRQICLADIFKSLVTLFLILSQVSFLCYYIWVGQEPHAIAYVSLTACGLYLHCIVFIGISEFAHHSSRILKKSPLGQSPCFSRLLNFFVFNRDWLTLFAFAAAIFLTLGGLFTTITDPVITRVVVPIKNMPLSSGRPIHVALLSDIHIGPSVGKSRIEKIVEITNKIQPDVIAISGDLADGFLSNLKEAAEPLCRLSAKHGVYFATGNHEYMHGNVEEWFGFLRSCNIHVLHNENRRLANVLPNATMCIAGMDDLYAVKAHVPGHGMDPKKALHGCLESDIRVLLAHQPNAASAVLRSNLSDNVDLILSGHTHAGQFYMFAPIIYVVNAFSHGLYYDHATDTHVMVSAGVNFFGPPVKMFGTCEIIDIQLIPRPAKGGSASAENVQIVSDGAEVKIQ